MFKLIKNVVFVLFVFLVGYLWGVKEVRFFEIVSSSMEPSLNIGDKILSVKINRIRRKDIVIINPPDAFDLDALTKRVIGLPGETIAVNGGDVFINGSRLVERYIKEAPEYNIEEITLSENEYFLLGDNRNTSEDSSSWGPVDKELIIARVICRYWPARDAGVLTSHPFRH